SGGRGRPDVGQAAVRVALVVLLDGVGAGGGQHDVVAVLGQVVAEELGHVPLVLDDEDAAAGSRVGSTLHGPESRARPLRDDDAPVNVARRGGGQALRARTKALMNLSFTCGAMASASRPAPASNSRASSAR